MRGLLEEKLASMVEFRERFKESEKTLAIISAKMEWIEKIEKRYFLDVCTFKLKTPLHPARIEFSLDALSRLLYSDPLLLLSEKNHFGEYVKTHGYIQSVSVAKNNHLIPFASFIKDLDALKESVPKDSSLGTKKERYSLSIEKGHLFAQRLMHNKLLLTDIATYQTNVMLARVQKQQKMTIDSTSKQRLAVRAKQICEARCDFELYVNYLS